MIKDEYFCLNCNSLIEFEEDSNYITTCEKCNWRNEINDTPAITPLTLRLKSFEDLNVQICYPLIEERDLRELPDGLLKAVKVYFTDNENFSRKMYQNIFHNLIKKNANDFDKIALKYQNKAKLARFFQSIENNKID